MRKIITGLVAATAAAALLAGCEQKATEANVTTTETTVEPVDGMSADNAMMANDMMMTNNMMANDMMMANNMMEDGDRGNGDTRMPDGNGDTK
jgi:ABC-type uncharacterized transport system auxiliary subunit